MITFCNKIELSFFKLPECYFKTLNVFSSNTKDTYSVGKAFLVKLHFIVSLPRGKTLVKHVNQYYYEQQTYNKK